jgi:hypothetical protein
MRLGTESAESVALGTNPPLHDLYAIQEYDPPSDGWSQRTEKSDRGRDALSLGVGNPSHLPSRPPAPLTCDALFLPPPPPPPRPAWHGDPSSCLALALPAGDTDDDPTSSGGSDDDSGGGTGGTGAGSAAAAAIVENWLAELGVVECLPAFRAAGVDIHALAAMADAELKALGVGKMGVRPAPRTHTHAHARAPRANTQIQAHANMRAHTPDPPHRAP